jgi:hypothetical protein
MKTFADLTIDLKGLPPVTFGELAETHAQRGWARDRSKDQEMNRTGGGTWFTFTLTGQKDLPAAFLFLTEKTSGTLYVPNVISPSRDRLSYEEYNQILQSFVEGVLVPVQQHHPIEFKMSNTEIDLAARLPREVYERLRRFSAAANKKTGSTHPFDQERWMDFLVATDEMQTPLDAHTLARWLVEVDGWEIEQASRLAEEYEFGRELLKRRKRAS